MRAYTASVWRYTSPSVKVDNAWKELASAFVRVDGVWKRSWARGEDNIVTTNIGDLIGDASAWTFTPDVGWYKDDREWHVPIYSSLPPETLARVRKVSATFNAWSNVPVGCIGENMMTLVTNLGAIAMGATDAWDAPASGMTVYPANNTGYNVVGEYHGKISYTLQDGEVLRRIIFRSSGFSDNGVAYPISKRGMTDFNLELI